MFHSERGHSFDFILCNTGWDNEQSRISVTHFIITVDLTDSPALIRQTLQIVWGQKNEKGETTKRLNEAVLFWLHVFSQTTLLFFFFLCNMQVSPFFYTQPLDHKPSIHPQEIALCIGRRIGTGREKEQMDLRIHEPTALKPITALTGAMTYQLIGQGEGILCQHI